MTASRRVTNSLLNLHTNTGNRKPCDIVASTLGVTLLRGKCDGSCDGSRSSTTTELVTEASDMQLVNCYFCGDSSQPRLMFLIDGANSSICGECLVETVHKALILDAEQSEEEEQI